MNPAQRTTSTPPPTETVLPASHITIVKVELPQQSNRRYDVMLRLCRPLTTYEIPQLGPHRSVGLDVSPDDPSQLIATHTTIEEVQDRLPEFHQLLTAAVADGHAAQDSATQAQKSLAVEEARRQSMVRDTNTRLGTCPHTHGPVVAAM